MVVQTLPTRDAAHTVRQRDSDWKLRVMRSDFGVIASYIRQLSEAGAAQASEGRPPQLAGGDADDALERDFGAVAAAAPA